MMIFRGDDVWYRATVTGDPSPAVAITDERDGKIDLVFFSLAGATSRADVPVVAEERPTEQGTACKRSPSEGQEF